MNLAAAADEDTRHVLLNEFARTLFVRRVADGPEKGDGHCLNPFALEQLNGAQDVLFVKDLVFSPVGKNPAADAKAQFTGSQLWRRGVVGVISVAFFLVPKTDLDAVPVAGAGKKADLDALELDQRIQRNGRSVDAEVAVAHDVLDRTIKTFGHLFQAIGNGESSILRG